MSHPIMSKVISGAQTGVDQGALDAAISLGIPTGGYCPRGRHSEAGPIPGHYKFLTETSTSNYAQRTLKNILTSQGTLLCILENPISGGTHLTRVLAEKNKKPYLLLNMTENRDEQVFENWIIQNHISWLNVAGPRESSFPGIQHQTKVYLEQLFAPYSPLGGPLQSVNHSQAEEQ